MESSTDIPKVTAAVISAFQTAADTLELIKDHKEKKKRKKYKDVEELLEIKILHKSLVEGGIKFRKSYEKARPRFWPTIEAGGDTAIQTLKNVVISLQTDIIQALQIARAVETTVIDLTALYESSIANCRDAVGAMDLLDQPLIESTCYQSTQVPVESRAVNNSASSMRSSVFSMQFSDLGTPFDVPPSPPGSIGDSRCSEYAYSSTQHTSPVRQGGMNPMAGSRAQTCSPNMLPLRMDNSHAQLDRLHPTVESTVAHERDTVHAQPPRTILTPTRERHYDTSRITRERTEPDTEVSTHWSVSKQGTYLLDAGRDERQQIVSPIIEAGSTPNQFEDEKRCPPYTSQAETTEDTWRASEAPEVAYDAFDGIYTLPPPPEEYPDKFLVGLTKDDFTEFLTSLPRGLEDIWLPLKRPAMHNRYHGFCKGAWQMRNAVHEGLEAQMTLAAEEPTVQWACKECQFRMSASTPESLLTQIFFNSRYNVRYRLLFLAKSHQSSERSCDALENYQYGCMFCAAHGHTTASYDKLEHLILHIVSKHKAKAITPEMKKKTKCIVGSVATQEQDWDVNTPTADQKASSLVADELFMSAARFFRRRKPNRK